LRGAIVKTASGCDFALRLQGRLASITGPSGRRPLCLLDRLPPIWQTWICIQEATPLTHDVPPNRQLGMPGYRCFPFGRCHKIGHHGSKVKIGERPIAAPGNWSIERYDGFESIQNTGGALDASANLTLINGATDARSKYALREHLPHHRHISVSVEDRNDVRHSGALPRLGWLKGGAGKRFVEYRVMACVS
jgi:hypothetical protein